MIENIGAYSQVDYDRGYYHGKSDAINDMCVRIENNHFDSGYRIGVSDTVEKCKEIVKEDCTKNCVHDYKCIDCLCFKFEQLKEQFANVGKMIKEQTE